MASVGEAEYESDPEEAKLSLKMRRREASDDEEEEREVEKREKSVRMIESDGESEGQGAAADYDEEEEEEEYDDEEYVEDEEDYEGDEYQEVGGTSGEGHEETVKKVEAVTEGAEGVKQVVGEGTGSGQGIDDDNENNVQGEEGKKENEPFAVPTAGAFYMHDDRFRDNAGGRHRRTFGGRKLWESRDERKWGHDKFEELTVEERHYDEGRRGSRGRYRGRGRGRGPGPERGTVRGQRAKAYVNDSYPSNNNIQKIQDNAPKGMRGRGPRRYRPTFKDNIDAPPLPNKQSGSSVEKRSYHSTAKASAPVSNVENDAATAAKQGFVSSLNSASPPFYPSSSSTKEINVTHKKELQTGTSSRSAHPSVLGDNSAASQSNSVLRGKNGSDSVSIDKLHISDPITAVASKISPGLQLAPGSSTISPTQSQPLRGQGRGFNAMPNVNYQSPVINNQFNRAPQPTNLNSTQRNPVLGRGQPTFQATGQQFAQRSGTRSQGSSPPKAGQSISETGEFESSSDSSKSKSAMVAKGKGTLQSTGRGSVLYGGAQVMGAPGSMGGGDQNFPTTPAFLPVMQFGGQHRGGIPAVGMAFPGYVGQPQLGLGNSEMTWLPVLAGAAGALGATYCSPYIAMDGAYHARPSGQISSLTAAPSKENSASKPNNESNPQQRLELSNDDLGQRQKNPRRYTEMKFDQ
ncbi:protein MLN51 homolog [Solanum lycopersicum]|uniref:Btz domain-containing protein n=1 Tax=Solanum lycopersicum TaxID=4081 RepID=A0A3Q7FV08_SOLLC|nr:protein MLN51 homolog [Solanum lycopersicum]